MNSEVEHPGQDPKAPDAEWQAEAVRRCLEGNGQAFAQITEAYGTLLLRTAYLLVRDEEAAKDIVQESFLLAWKNLARLREPGALRSWLLSIVVRQSSSWRRQLLHKATLLREQLSQSLREETLQHAAFAQGAVEDRLDIWRAIDLLPHNQRVVLVLFYYHRLSMPEIARLLDVEANTLRKRLSSALEKLRRMLQRDALSKQDTTLMPEHVNAQIGMQHGGESR